jgi:hypothetical protein
VISQKKISNHSTKDVMCIRECCWRHCHISRGMSI